MCGGAKLYNVKLPAKNPYKYSEHLTYLFVDATTAPLTKSLQDYGVLCLDADFISDYIVLVRINYLCVGRFIEILNHFENKKSWNRDDKKTNQNRQDIKNELFLISTTRQNSIWIELFHLPILVVWDFPLRESMSFGNLCDGCGSGQR